MVVKGALVAALLAASLLSGCVSGVDGPAPARSRDPHAGAVEALGGRMAEPLQPSADAAAGGQAPQPIEPAAAGFRVTAQAAPSDLAPWYLAALEVPEGQSALAGFRWTVPAGAVHESEDYEGLEGVSLEVAPLLPEGGTLDSFSVAWFNLDGETPRLLGMQLGVPMRAVTKVTPLLQDEVEVEVAADPAFLYLDEDLVGEGDTLGIVVAAQGGLGAFGLAFRVLDENVVYSDEEPAATATAFLRDAMADGDGLALATAGAGSGFQFALYLDLNIAAAVGITITAGPVEVVDAWPTEAARPTATVRDLTVSSRFTAPAPDDGGWGLGAAIYATAAGAATWSLRGDVHGEAVDAGGIAVGTPAALMPVIEEASGGEGADGELTLTMTIASADEIEILGFLTLDYGTAISALLGSQPPAPGFAGGAVGSVQASGRDLVLPLEGGASLRLLGGASLAASA